MNTLTDKISQTQRLFVGIEISDTNKRKIENWRKPFLKTPIRWIPVKDLHITLVPPWDETDIESAKERLSLIQNEFGKFNIEFHKVLPGPNPKHPRLIWIDGDPNPKMNKLTFTLQDFFNIYDKHSSNIPHITIARFPRKFGLKKTQSVSGELHFTETVKEISLIKSNLTPSCSILTTVHKVKI